MRFRKLTYNCHDGRLMACKVGPQREVTLEIQLHPASNRDGPPAVTIRFGAISNFEEVRRFFEQVQQSRQHDALDEVVGIGCREKGKWIVDLAREGAVTIDTSKMPQEQ